MTLTVDRAPAGYGEVVCVDGCNGKISVSQQSVCTCSASKSGRRADMPSVSALSVPFLSFDVLSTYEAWNREGPTRSMQIVLGFVETMTMGLTPRLIVHTDIPQCQIVFVSFAIHRR